MKKIADRFEPFGDEIMSQSESNTICEKLLVLRAQDRDKRAFQELVTRYERQILYYIRRLLGKGADLADVMQEIWMRVFLRITTLRTPEAFRVWLYKIAHDVVVDQLRKNKRQQKVASLGYAHTSEAATASHWNECELFENAELAGCVVRNRGVSGD